MYDNSDHSVGTQYYYTHLAEKLSNLTGNLVNKLSIIFGGDDLRVWSSRKTDDKQKVEQMQWHVQGD